MDEKIINSPRTRRRSRAALSRVFSLVPLLAASVALGAKVGDTYESVLSEKGTPKSQVLAGAMRMLGYSDVTIKFKDDVVVSIKAVVSTPSIPGPTASSSPPTTQHPETAGPKAPAAVSVDALRAQLKDAVDHVNQIVNQPVDSVPRTRENWNRCGWFEGGWFHPGAATPDFNNVDVRKTQETKSYDQSEYVSSSLTPKRAFVSNELEFNSMTKIFYQDRSLPKKRLTEEEMLEINRLYRIIGKSTDQLASMGVSQ